MNLYFLDNDGRQHLVAKDVSPYSEYEKQEIYKAMIEDLAKRKPDFTIHYSRNWFDQYHRFWIDFGSHTEFYICQEPKQSLYLYEID